MGGAQNTWSVLTPLDSKMGDIDVAMGNLMNPMFDYLGGIVSTVFSVVGIAILVFIAVFLVCSRINPFKLSPSYLEGLHFRFMPYDVIRWWLYDLLTRREKADEFAPFGFTIFCGPQGGGKTISMVRYLGQMKERYPECIIVTNFTCRYADKRMTDWHDLLEIRNGTKGVIFAIDEIQAEYSSASWKTFPEVLLSQISMQRKQKIKIVATSQVYSRVAKPIREQTFSVVVCSTWFGRLTSNKEYDASIFETTGDSDYRVKRKIKPLWRCMFAQSNDLREAYDTYEVVERMRKVEFIPRGERGPQM